MSYERYEVELNDSPFPSRLLSAEIKRGRLVVRAACPQRGVKWTGFVVSYNHKVEADREAYFIPPASNVEGKKEVRLTLDLELPGFPFRYTHWSILCVYEKDGEVYGSRILMGKKKKTSVKDFLLKAENYKTKDGDIVFLYTQRGNYLGIRYRQRSRYDSRTVRVKECVARFHYAHNRKAYNRRGIYLIYEKRCRKAQDNGYYLFKHCMENGEQERLNREIYYVIEKDAPDRKKLKAYEKNVVDFMSIRHMVYLQAANCILSPDSRAHAYAWQVQQSVIANKIRKVPHVFLGHGVLALKRLNESFTAKNMQSVLCTVTSEEEKKVFTDELGFKGTQVAITGYARFDALRDTSDEHREILMMPTHRSWLFGVEREVFTNSDYYKRYMDLINSPHLVEQLEKHDLTLMFYVHPSIGEHADAFTSNSSRVVVVPYEDYALDDLMMRCKLLVTDYSSIAWDVYYMGKPAVFYQYDTQEYLDTWGSYIDLEQDCPGERVTTHDDLLALIDSYIEGGFALKEEYAAKREERFAFLDDQSSRRICDELKRRRF